MLKISLAALFILTLSLVGMVACSEEAPPPTTALTATQTGAPPAEVPTATTPPPVVIAAAEAPTPTRVPTAKPTATTPPTPKPIVAPTARPTAEPTAAPAPTATPAPAPTPTPRPTLTGYIPALDGHVAEMKFYESTAAGYKAVPHDNRVYRKAFPRLTTRYVNGELLITFPTPDRRIDFKIEAVFSQSDGSVVARRTINAYVNENWRRGSGYWAFGTGSSQPSRWKAGLYHVDLSVDGKLIASEEFEIIDRNIPASGPFLELQDGLPWAGHPLDLDEENALLALSSMMEADPALAAQVASLPWVRQVLTVEGRNALQALDILATADADLAKRVADFSWLADGVSKDEWLSLRTLAQFAATDVEFASLIVGFPWLTDDVTEDESQTIQYIREIVQEAPAVAGTLLAFVWLADGVTEDEAWAIQHLRLMMRANPAMAKVVLESPWFSDGVTRTESRIIGGLRSLYDLDHSSISTLTAKPWFKDGLSDEEFMLLGDLGDIARRSEAHFLAIIGMPFLETFEPVDALAARSLRRLACCDDGGSKEFRRVMAHPTISDGISDEETAIVATLNDVRFYSTDIYEQLLDPDTVTMEERTIDLPHTGETQLTVVRIRPGAERTMDLLERAVRTVEGFAAMPFPVKHVIFLAENTHRNRVSIDLTHMSGEHERFDTDERPEIDALHVLAHETAHYYWFHEWNLHWIEDGLGAFFQSFVRRQAKVGPGVPVVPIWPAHRPPCPIGGNIAELERLHRQHGVKTDCSDSLGERLFQDLWRTLGDSVFRQGLGNLYLMARSGAPVGGCGYAKAGMCKVEAAFKAAAPAEAAATVDQVLGRWYYNSEPYDLSQVDVSPPNPKLPGGIEVTQAYISLDRDRREATRTDRFSASEIRERVYLSLHFSSPEVQQAQELPLTVVEYFEDGFPYRIMDGTGRAQSTRSYSVGPRPNKSWIVADTPERTRIVWGNVETPPKWATGRYWVSVYHEEQKVAEVEFQVTP